MSAYNALLHEVCVGLGFCGSVVNGEPLHVSKVIPMEGHVSADQFVEWVLRAEGMDPKGTDAVDVRGLREAFIRHMGSEVVAAQTLE